MAGPVEEAPPDSWEAADLDATMSRLMLSPSNRDSSSSNSPPDVDASALGLASSNSASSDDLVNSVDQFLREALQNPRERLSVLRMEQDVEKFIRDPTQQQMEFQQLPTSYLRLAAHRIAQHYSLQSMVLMDNNLDGSASRIIIRKTSECRLPLIRLADIPVTLPTEDSGAIKVAIKQRPQKRSQAIGGSNSHSSKTNSSKSVEERKEEYNRARARIFSGDVVGKPETERRVPDHFQHVSVGLPKFEEISPRGATDVNMGRSSVESSTGSSRSARSRTEKEPVGRFRTNNRVAIFRDREVERKDPDFDRSYDRYAQRFDPGFGFNGGTYTIQPLYSPVVNYNTEFPQLGAVHRPPMSEHQPRPLPPQHLPGSWAAQSTPAGMGYGPPETMMTTAFTPNHHVGPHSVSGLYMHPSQYPCQRPGMPFIHPHEQQQQVHQAFSQSHQQQHDATFGLARPR